MFVNFLQQCISIFAVYFICFIGVTIHIIQRDDKKALPAGHVIFVLCLVVKIVQIAFDQIFKLPDHTLTARKVL